jgi:hypothetical protein
MKYVLVALVVLLAAGVVYLQVSQGYRVESLNRRIAELESQNKALRDDYEARIARLGQARAVRRSSPVPPGGFVADAAAKTAAAAGITRDPVEALRDAVKLDDTQEKTVRSVLADFAKARQDVFAQAQAEKRFPFDARSLAMVTEARRAALERVRATLTDAQYARMVEEGHDEKLGLRLDQPAR